MSDKCLDSSTCSLNNNKVITINELTKAYGDNELVGEDSRAWSEHPVEPEDLELEDRVEFLPPTTGSKTLAFFATSKSAAASLSSSFESSRKDKEVQFGKKCWFSELLSVKLSTENCEIPWVELFETELLKR